MDDLSTWEQIGEDWAVKMDDAQRRYGDNHPMISVMEEVSYAIVAGDRSAYHAAMHLVFEAVRTYGRGDTVTA